jgi:hypothetical protein
MRSCVKFTWIGVECAVSASCYVLCGAYKMCDTNSYGHDFSSSNLASYEVHVKFLWASYEVQLHMVLSRCSGPGI